MILWAAVCLAAFFLMSGKEIRAEETPGSICVIYHGRTMDDERIALSEVPFALYEVGEFKDGTWVLSGPFEGSGISLEGASSSEKRIVAEELYEYAKEHGIAKTEKDTDINGVVQFFDLKERMYLIAQTTLKVVGVEDTFWSEPFLVKVPSLIDGAVVYDVTVEPKSSWGPDNDLDPAPDPNPDPDPDPSPGETEPNPGPEETEPDSPDSGGGSGENPGGGSGGGSSWNGGNPTPEKDSGMPSETLPVETLPIESESVDTPDGGWQETSARTGDFTELGKYVTGLVVSMGVIGFLLYRRIRKS